MAKDKVKIPYEDDEHVIIDVDIERIQTRTGMYIGYKGSQGALHLTKEIINNMIDECTNIKSPGRNITILLDTKANTLMTMDDGRGIPFDKMVDLCTKIQSGSKMTRSTGGGASAGENGVGMTATNALSERFESISHRGGEEASIKFHEGKLVQDLTVKKSKDKDQHGQTFIFKPSDKYLSVEDDPAIIDRDQLEKWVENVSYLLPSNITIRFNVVDNNGKMYSKKYRNKEGMKELLEKTFNKLTDTIHISDIMYFDEKVQGETFKRYTGIEIAMAYSTSDSEEYINSFCNFVNTVDGGTHVNAVQGAIINVLKTFTEETLSEAQAKKINIIPNDIRNGLKVTINVKTESDPQFSGQVKEKVNSQLLYKQIRPMILHNLRSQLNSNDKLKKKITDMIKTNAKARIAADAEKDAVIKRSKTEYLDMYDLPRFIPSNVRSRNEYSEVLVVEGDSAGNAIKSKGLPFQAALYLKGVSLNAFTAPLNKVVGNAELNTFIRVCQAGVGDKFDLSKFFYNKVILMPDGDSDGNNIFSTFSAFLLRWMRPLVEAGMVYRALPPLYKIVDKENPFIRSKQEYFEVYVERVIKKVRVGSTKTGIMSKQELRDLLYNNRDYLEELDRLVKYFGVHPHIIEYIVFHIADKDFEKKFKKRFPELKLDSKSVSGVYEGNFQFLKLSKRFFKYAKELSEIVFQESNKALYYQMYNKDGKELSDRGEYSLGDLLKECLVYKPKIVTRYKGLGELKPGELQETTLNPNNRLLVKLTVSDINRALEVADIFHGNDSSKRQEANSKFKIRRDELDN